MRANTYSVPSRLRGEKVRVRIYDDRLEVFYAQKCQLTVERLGRADLEYLGCLKLAAETMECEVEAALEALLEEGELPTADAVRDLVELPTPIVPRLALEAVDLGAYDSLLESGIVEAAS